MAISNTLLADRKVVWDNPPRPQRIGLVLGGGAARGIAHVGVLQVLEENGIYPAVVAGTQLRCRRRQAENSLNGRVRGRSSAWR